MGRSSDRGSRIFIDDFQQTQIHSNLPRITMCLTSVETAANCPDLRDETFWRRDADASGRYVSSLSSASENLIGWAIDRDRLCLMKDSVDQPPSQLTEDG